MAKPFGFVVPQIGRSPRRRWWQVVSKETDFQHAIDLGELLTLVLKELRKKYSEDL
jgi:hypothetical protein